MTGINISENDICYIRASLKYSLDDLRKDIEVCIQELSYTEDPLQKRKIRAKIADFRHRYARIENLLEYLNDCLR